MRTRPTLLVLLLAALLAATAAPAAADDLIAKEERLTPVSGYRDWTAWSAWDPEMRRYRLVGRRAGEDSRVLPIPPRRAPFDVDLGPDPRGDVSAVYSRCRTERTLDRSPWMRGTGCDIYRYEFVTGRESRVAGANTPRHSEHLPTIWKGQVAFVRQYRSDNQRVVYVRPVLGGGASQRVRSGPACPPSRSGCIAGPNSMELWGRRLAIGWDVFNKGPSFSQMRLTTLRRARQHVRVVGEERAREGSVAQLFAPAFSGDGDLYWGIRRRGATETFHFGRWDLVDGPLMEAAAPGILVSMSRYRYGLVYVQADDVYLPPSCNNFTEQDLRDRGCSIARATGLEWKRVRSGTSRR